jgi:hypothetical protein
MTSARLSGEKDKQILRNSSDRLNLFDQFSVQHFHSHLKFSIRCCNRRRSLLPKIPTTAFNAGSQFSRHFFASNSLRCPSVSFDIRSSITQSVKMLQLRVCWSTCGRNSQNESVDYANIQNHELRVDEEKIPRRF